MSDSDAFQKYQDSLTILNGLADDYVTNEFMPNRFHDQTYKGELSREDIDYLESYFENEIGELELDRPKDTPRLKNTGQVAIIQNTEKDTWDEILEGSGHFANRVGRPHLVKNGLLEENPEGSFSTFNYRRTQLGEVYKQVIDKVEKMLDARE